MFPVPYNSNQTGNNDFHGSNDRNFTAFRDVLQTFIIEDIADCRWNQRIEESPEKNSGIECEFSMRNSHGNAKKNSGKEITVHTHDKWIRILGCNSSDDCGKFI